MASAWDKLGIGDTFDLSKVQPKLKLTDDTPPTTVQQKQTQISIIDKIKRGWDIVTSPDNSEYNALVAADPAAAKAAANLAFVPTDYTSIIKNAPTDSHAGESLVSYRSPLSGQDVVTRTVRGATQSTVSLANALQLGNAKNNKWILDDIAKNDDEYKLSQIKTPERLAEYKAVQKQMEDAKTIPQIAKAAIAQAADSVMNPNDANIAGFVGGMFGDLSNLALPSLAAKVGSKFVNRGAGALAGAGADALFNGATGAAQSYSDLKRQGKSDAEALKGAVSSATVGSVMGGAMGAPFGAMAAKGKAKAIAPETTIAPIIDEITKAKNIHPEDMPTLQAHIAEVEKIADEYIAENSSDNIYAATLNEHEAKAAAESEAVKQTVAQMLGSGNDIASVQSSIDNLITPTREDLHISDVLNSGKPLPSKYTGMRFVPLVENSINTAASLPDKARTNKEFYEILKRDGVSEELASVMTKAYAAKDVNIVKEYAFEKLKDSELFNAAKTKAEAIAAQVADERILAAHSIADNLIDARAAAAGMSREEWDAAHTLETIHYPDMSKEEVDGFGKQGVDDAATPRDVFDSVYMAQNDFKGGQYVKNDVGIRRDMIERLDRKVSNFEQLNEKEAADYEYIKQYAKESGALEAYQKAKAEDTTPPPEMVLDEGSGEYMPKAEYDALMEEAAALFSKDTQKATTDDLGVDYPQFKSKPKEAISHLLEVKNGQVIGALYHPEIGEIDIAYGKVTNAEKHEGYGLAHIVDKHGEAVARRLDEIIMGGKRTKTKGNTVELVNGEYGAVIKLDWAGKEKKWVLTAFEETPRQTITDGEAFVSKSGNLLDKSDEILHNKQPESQEFIFKGLYKKYGDTHIINTFKEADFGTVLHEYGHYFRKTLSGEELAAANEAFGVKDGVWERAHDEHFAEAFVKWLSDGKEPTSVLEGVFAKLKSFLADLFRQNPKSHEALVSLDERQREFFAAIFGDAEAAKKIYSEMEAKAKPEIVNGVELYQKERLTGLEDKPLPPKMEEQNAKTQNAIHRINDWWDELVEKGADKIEDGVQWARDKTEGTIGGKLIHGLTVGKDEKAAARLLQDMTIAKHQINEEAKGIQVELAKLSEEDRTSITRALGGDMDAATLPEHLRSDYEAMRGLIDRTTARMVELGALAKENAHENYVKRVYKDHKNRLDAFTAAAGLKLGGEGRKIIEKTYTLADADKFAKDIEAVYPSDELNLHSKSLENIVKILTERGLTGKIEKGKLQIIRHEDGSITTKRWLTHDERLAIGMLEDASVVVPDTIKAQQSQILKATLLKKIADQYASDIAVDGWVQIPDETVAGIKKYGALSGKYVNPEIHRTLISSRMVSDGIGLLERGLYPLMDHLKVNMTVKNPVTHMYNVGSNAMLVGLHGHTISLGKVLTMRVADKAAFDALVKDANKYGLNSNLMDIETRPDVDVSAKNPIAMIWNEIYMSQGSKTGDAIRNLYEWEDKIFKLAAFKDKLDAYEARNPDKTPTAKEKRAMMDEANAEYIDYSTPVPPIFRALDKSGVMPFLHYQIKAAPMVVKAAAKHPLRWALIVAGLYASGWSNIGEDEDENKKPFWAADMYNIFFAKNYVKIGDDLYWNLGRLLPGFRFGGLNLVMPNQHGELEPAGGIPGGVLRILSGSDPLGRKFGSKYDGFGEMIKDRFEEFAKAYMPSITTGRYAIGAAKLGATKVGITPEYIIDPKTGEMKPNPDAPKNSYKEPMTFTELYQRMVGIRKFSAAKELERKASEAKNLKNYEVKEAKESGDLEKQLAAETEYQKTMLDLTGDGYSPQSKPSKGGGASIRLNLGMPKPKKWD